MAVPGRPDQVLKRVGKPASALQPVPFQGIQVLAAARSDVNEILQKASESYITPGLSGHLYVEEKYYLGWPNQTLIYPVNLFLYFLAMEPGPERGEKAISITSYIVTRYCSPGRRIL
jgi:hypothetical protein